MRSVLLLFVARRLQRGDAIRWEGWNLLHHFIIDQLHVSTRDEESFLPPTEKLRACGRKSKRSMNACLIRRFSKERG